MVEFSAEMLAKLGMSSLSENQKRYAEEREREEAQKLKKNLEQQERNMGQRFRGGGGGFKSRNDNRNEREQRRDRPVIAREVHGIYGKVRRADSAPKPQAIATAPYNFIPLPAGVLPSPLDVSVHDILLDAEDRYKKILSREEKKAFREAFRHFLTEGDHYSGTIDLEIENLTPLFIGGNSDESETFAPAGEKIIPGSELRGMVKNLVKMLTCGSWKAGEDMVDRHLYYRCMMASNRDPQNKELCAMYTNYMTTRYANKQVKKNARPGFLVKRRSRYVIYPLLENKLHSIPIMSYMEKDGLDDKKVDKSKVRWDEKTAYIQVGLLSTSNLRTKEQLDKSQGEERKKWGKQYYRFMSVADIDKSKCYEVPPEIIAEYRDDKNRRGMDLIKQEPMEGVAPKQINGLEEYQSIIPCFFFLEDDGKRVKSFGHGQSYRIPYDHSTMDLVDEELKKDTIDFASAMFGRSGNTVSWASRISFDDAVQKKDMGILDEAKAHALMQPNPTSFQLYLQQDNKEKLNFWDSQGAKIRGYKLYWHNRDGHDWRASETEIKNLESDRGENAVQLLKPIKPMKAGAKFKGHIRFWDLTKAELGALMKVFCMAEDGENIAYKIGMGKSIGLGSIRISPTLYLEDGSRYLKLFDEGGWHVSLQKKDPREFVVAYEDYVRDAMNGKLWESYQNTLRNMRLMLDYRNVKDIEEWEAATSPMNGNTKEKNPEKKDDRFKLRSVLPSVLDVVEKAKKGL